MCSQSISNIETTRAFEEAIEEYRQAERIGPIEIESLRASMERRRAADPTEELSITDSIPIDVVERRLDEERADLAAVEVTLAALDSGLEVESQRPGRAREWIEAVRLLLDEATEVTEFRPSAQENPLLAEATRWTIETRTSSLLGTRSSLRSQSRIVVARIRIRDTVPVASPMVTTSPTRTGCSNRIINPQMKLATISWRPKRMPTPRAAAAQLSCDQLAPSRPKTINETIATTA